MQTAVLAAAPPLQLGQRFRRASLWPLGQGGSEWILRDLYVGSDDLWQARIVRASGTKESKTLPVAALTDRRKFTPA